MQDIKYYIMKITLAQLILPFFGVIVLPSGVLVAWMCAALVIDLITGITRAIVDDETRTSEKYRNTLGKVIQYGGALIIGVILTSMAKHHADGLNPEVLNYFNNSLVSFIIFIEITSTMENMYTISPKSKFSKYFVKPMLSLLTFNLQHLSNMISSTKNINNKVKENDK